MGRATNRNPASRAGDALSARGGLQFRPRTTIVLVSLTLMVAVVGWRIARDTGGGRVDVLARAAIGFLETVPSPEVGAPLPGVEEASRRFRAIVGISVEFPRDDDDFVPVEVRKETFANRPAALLWFRYAGEGYLLLVSTPDRLLGTSSSFTAFPEGMFVSGEREGKSFVLWEREGASCIVVSGADVTRTFDLVRRLFS
jgi:hypothetical protein